MQEDRGVDKPWQCNKCTRESHHLCCGKLWCRPHYDKHKDETHPTFPLKCTGYEQQPER